MNYVEVEAKFYMPDLEAVKTRLVEVGAELTVPRVYERNVRYENAEKSLTEQGIVVRLRQDNRVRLTYKEPAAQTDERVSTRFEAEVDVSDFTTMDLILGKLGFGPYLIYEKYRTTYELNHAEILLDELPYGNFVEIEGELEAIHALIQTLGFEDAKSFTSNYMTLFDNVRHNMNLEFNDLTYDNFAGITVLPDAFEPAGDN